MDYCYHLSLTLTPHASHISEIRVWSGLYAHAAAAAASKHLMAAGVLGGDGIESGIES